MIVAVGSQKRKGEQKSEMKERVLSAGGSLDGRRFFIRVPEARKSVSEPTFHWEWWCPVTSVRRTARGQEPSGPRCIKLSGNTE